MGTRFQLMPAALASKRAEIAFERIAHRLRRTLPPGAELFHVGATAVRNCLTKGDLDVLVRVPQSHFASADKVLARQFRRNTGSARSHDLSAFELPSRLQAIGIQLVAINGQYDFFLRFRDALRADDRLIRQYNLLKLRFNGCDMELYRKIKARFVERVIFHS